MPADDRTDRERADAHEALGHMKRGSAWQIPVGSRKVDWQRRFALAQDWGSAWELESLHYRLRSNLPLEANLGLAVRVGQRLIQGLPLRLRALPHLVDKHVRDDAVEPVLERHRAVVAVEKPVRPQECFLSQVLGRMSVTSQVIQPAVQPVVVGAGQRGKGVPVTLLGVQGKAALYRQIVQNDQRFTDELRDRYRDIAVPTLVLWGEHDRWIPLAQGRELAGLIPGAELRVIPGADHLVQHDAPAAVAVDIAAFLSG